MENICPTCKSQLKFVPAGVSRKTGKPYQGFFTCPNRCPKPAYSPTYAPQDTNVPQEPEPKSDWDKINNGKSNDIRANVALKMVSEILAGGQIPLSDWKLWADNFYNYNPNK